MIRAALLTLCAALLVAACGSTSHSSSASSSTHEAMASTATKPAVRARPTAVKGTTVKLTSSQYGQIVADGRGQAFYLFGKERSARSECYGECASKWPPVLTKGTPHAGPGGRSQLVGTTRRSDGKLQLTYAGHPVYYYQGDSPGRVLCQGVTEFGGPWLVVRANGTPVQP
jgi:predicted lipoprotein with Yx(FWY)xxD motif